MTAFALALAMMAAVLPKAHALSNEETQIRQKISSDYQKCLEATEKESLGGFCGLTASWQLYFMGINRYPLMADGNKQFDTYRDMEVTTGGYHPKAYSAEDYTLEQALNAITKNGTRDAYNIVVGFEKTTTEAGQQYGHAVVVYAILDGMVYFTETFATSFGSQEGQPVAMSISQFARYYQDWMTFEGVILFGQKSYLDQCTAYPADLFAVTNDAAVLLAEPRAMMDGQEPVEVYRAVRSGELLHVTGLYCNPHDQYFYEVEEAGNVAYISAQRADFLMYNEDGVSYETGKQTEGRITADYACMTQLQLKVWDGTDTVSCRIHQEGQVYNLESQKIRSAVSKAAGEDAEIREIAVTLRNYRLEKDKPVFENRTVPMLRSAGRRAAEPRHVDGWNRENGRWYYYWNGSPVTGWLNYRGCHYYMNYAGAASTGQQIIDGKSYFFGPNGALQDN